MNQKFIIGQWVRIIGRSDRGLVGAYEQQLGYFVLGRWWLVVAE